MQESIYYDIAGLLSQRCIINFIIGNRGGGKTYAAKKLVIKRFLNKGKKFVWIRRYQSEIDAIFADAETGDFWGSVKRNEELNKKYPDLQYSASGNNLFLNDKVAGNIVPLSTSMQLKSIDWDEVTTVIFDEFIIDKGRTPYLKNEVHVFLELMETIGRMRDDIVFVLIGNGISVDNPYFRYFHVAPKLNQRYTKFKRGICIEFYFNEKFIAIKEKTKLGRLIAGTDYGEYNMRNKFLRDSDSFLAARLATANYKMYQFIFDGDRFSLWQDYKYQCYYIDRNYEQNFGEFRTFVSNPIDMVDSDKSMIMFKKNSAIFKRLNMLIERGDLFFCDQSAKQQFYEKLLTTY